ncbi:MAG: NADH:flavin oxidoreductase [Gammaproteobacteria bacterium]|jgi:2,4-dienoyl-CoA reductase-like NADH-dependent reductase (Old Yellow Enzyme family)|nr:NADH:flavin oxidoreductase [Gammaproteobacteria bacterium]
MDYGNTILFEAFEHPKLSLPNRIVMAPCTRMMAENQTISEESAAYYRRRAEGGMALIITEATTIDHDASSGHTRAPAIHGETSLAGWKHVIDEVHDAGGKIAPQLWHVGATRDPATGPNPTVPAVSPSGYLSPGIEAGVAITDSGIADVISAYAKAAADAKAIGFDSIEIHGAHGYLIDAFFWDQVNLRDDEYGGPLENRTRMAVEVVSAIREAVGEDFPIIFRHSQWKSGHYDFKVAETPEEVELWLGPLSDAGVDIFHASMRRFWLPEFEGSPLNLAGWVKKITGKPTIAVGSVGLDKDYSGQSIDAPTNDSASGKHSKSGDRYAHYSEFTDLDQLVGMMERGDFDLIAVGRASLAEPDWPNKVREGRTDEIAPYTKDVLKELY